MYKKKLRDGEFSSYRLYFFRKRYLTNWYFKISSHHKIIKYIVVIFCVGEFVCGRIHRNSHSVPLPLLINVGKG